MKAIKTQYVYFIVTLRYTLDAIIYFIYLILSGLLLSHLGIFNIK